MKTRSSLSRIAMAAVVACLFLSSAQARTVQQKKQAARSQFEAAERLHAALARKPESQRTHGDYQKVMDAFRKVYYTAPTSNKADLAVLTVAQLLDEQARVLKDTKSYHDAIGQLVFLRREYPGSKYRAAALFTIGEIYRDDLNDNAQAKATFEDYLKHYPGSHLAPEARRALVETGTAEVGGNPFKKHATKAAKVQPHDSKTKAAWADLMPSSTPEEKATRNEKPEKAEARPSKTASAKDTIETAPSESDDSAVAQAVSAPGAKTDSQGAHRVAHLTSVRHWSTPDYTRVAIDIDVEQEVKYQSGRVPRPSRIFFDLHDTRLAADLVGKSFDVEAGFLHRIRVSQYKANLARVVLDVDDVTEYSAFFLPNPYRLIIDIHGKLPSQQASAGRTEGKQPVTKPPDSGPDTAAIQSKPSTSARPTTGSPSSNQTETTATLKAHDSKPQESRTSARDHATAEKHLEAAKSDLPKTIADDPVVDDDVPAKTTSKPTTGPTFQAIAPQESSRGRKRLQDNTASAATATARVASPTAQGERSLIRTLGLKIGKIVVDAGHGGHDTGTVGPNGLMEKELVLDVALKLGKLLEERLGAEVVYTRDDDTFIPLETRTAIANKEQADLFISIHANSSGDSSARGVETYYLNFTSSKTALEVASRENAVSEKSIHELQDLVKKIALKEKIDESREFAADVNRSLYTGLSAKSPGIQNRGVKKAPFIVLIGANMPSILAEISFVSNPTDESKLKTNEYRQRVAESLYKGINKYVSGLSGVKTASKVEDRSSTKGTPAMALK
jgi:N-acetylmuramoyl-L-alanine amidase